jgi:hypothetical protein
MVALSPTTKETAVQFWTTEQRGAVAIATFSNPPRNYVVAPVIDELESLTTPMFCMNAYTLVGPTKRYP